MGYIFGKLPSSQQDQNSRGLKFIGFEMKTVAAVLLIFGISVVHQATCDGGATAALAAITAIGGSLISSGGGGGYTALLPSGVKVDPYSCWRDGGGACPNGNCLDNNGRRGVVIKEEIVGCKWFCFHRGSCRTQLCCTQKW